MGAEVLVDYDVKKIDPATATTIKVIATGGQEAGTTFDMGSLR
jgi:hypothetical protein